jgi:tRNA-splicing ligase RtcB
MSFKVEGEHNTAKVFLNESDVEDGLKNQIQEMVNAEAMEGDSDIRIMPDCHVGSGAVIGFTLPVKNKICPNTVGVDISCGMTAVCFGEVEIPEDKIPKLDKEIRKEIPLGFEVHDRSDYHMVNDFPYTDCEIKWDRFAEATDFDLPQDEIPKFPRDTFFENLCKRAGEDMTRAINSLGSLGGGNHFVELGYDSKERLWCIVHSGSRGIGAKTAEYWQNRASKLRSIEDVRNYLNSLPDEYLHYVKFDPHEVSDEDLLDWVQGGMGEDFVDYEVLKSDYKDSDPEKIEEIARKLKDVLQYADTSNRNTDLDYLKGEEAHGYIKDMIFLHTYASESRKKMARGVEEAISEVVDEPIEQKDFIESVHNYLDFEDGTIRKGACKANNNEKIIIPMNMNYGTLICRGKGCDDWNNSAPHGAGRAMSRTEAKNRYDEDDMEEQTGDTYLSVTPVDECPKSYKTPEMIKSAIGPTANVADRVKPILSVKAE